MYKHSPEPWVARPIGRGALGIWDDLGRLVAETNNTANTCDRRPGSPSTPEAIAANGALMAGSPDLLKVLEACPTLHSAAWAHLHLIRSEDAFTKEMYQWITQARAAIAAARA